MRPSLSIRKALAAGLLAVAAAALGGCEEDDLATWATVVEVDELESRSAVDERSAPYEEQLEFDPAWRVELQLDDGAAISLVRSGERRFEPGERVRVLKTPDGRLLL